MSEIIIDSIKDTYIMLPLLFITYLIIEYFEHKENKKLQTLEPLQKYGVLFGALAGLIPQCGFSIVAAMLYVQKSITLGTLVAVFIATSDEAIPILLANPSMYTNLFAILALKFVLAIGVGYLVDKIFVRKTNSMQVTNTIYPKGCSTCEISEGSETCSHHEHSLAIIAFAKAIKIFAFLFITTLVLNILIASIGENHLHEILLTNSVLQPFVAALFGFIPNCVASVILTQLYVSGSVTFASLFAGLVSNAGLGLVVLFKYKANKKDILRIAFILYCSAVMMGLLLQLW